MIVNESTRLILTLRSNNDDTPTQDYYPSRTHPVIVCLSPSTPPHGHRGNPHDENVEPMSQRRRGEKRQGSDGGSPGCRRVSPPTPGNPPERPKARRPGRSDFQYADVLSPL